MGIGKLQSAAKLPALLNQCLTVDMMYMEHRVLLQEFLQKLSVDGTWWLPYVHGKKDGKILRN